MALLFSEVQIQYVNLKTKFVFFRRKSRELLSFVFGPSSYLKYRFQLSAYRRRKNGCLTFCSQIRIRNIFSISLDQSSQNLIVGKKYVSGLFTSHNRFQNVQKSDLQSPFRQQLLNGEEFLYAALLFQEVHIRCLNQNTNIVFFSMEIKRVIVVCFWPCELPEIRIPIFSQTKGVKVEV